MTPTTHALPDEPAEENRRHALVLDLSGDERAAIQWAAERFDNFKIDWLNKAGLKWTSKFEALARIRSMAPHTFAIFTSDLNLQSSRCGMMLFGMLAGAKRIILADSKGRSIERARAGAWLFELPRLLVEMAFGYLLVIPLSWLLTLFLGLLLRFRYSRGRSTNRESEAALSGNQTALYILSTLTGAKEGGMATHVAGFVSGAEELGHRLCFLTYGNLNDAPPTGNRDSIISPSAAVSASRAIFELWNNLRLTARGIWLMSSKEMRNDIDFIYQRYSRFNWTGVAASLVTGLPLALEFNGSEVWVSQSWDPVGQLSLLQKFERLNQRAADFIFTVSEVERGNLINAGVEGQKIVVNPNGVDVNQFHPACGGREVRRALSLEKKIVVGFLGTFGPWHGAPVLAQAARLVSSRCHFLFIGDGDERAITEEKIGAAKRRATFVGRISHGEVPAYLDACDILVSPQVPASDGSEFFGSPTKLFEYLAMQKAVIASRLGQIAAVIVDGENGLLVEASNVGTLARAIDRLAMDEDLRARLGESARQTVIESYTWRHNAARVFEMVKGEKKRVERIRRTIKGFSV